MPRAAYMVVNMLSQSRATEPSISVSSDAFERSTGSPNSRISTTPRLAIWAVTGATGPAGIVGAMSAPEHYFSPDPRSRRRTRTVTLDLADVSADLRTDRGVFSAQRVDPGTRLLLKHAPLPAVGESPPANGTTPAGGVGSGPTLADVGCGYGPIAVALALRAPGATLWAVDVNERARELTATNLTAAGVSVAGPGGRTTGRAIVCSPEEVPESLRFDGFYCNPPVRIGNKALDDLLLTWLQRLHPHGFAVVVMHKNLGADSFVRRLAERSWTSRRLAIGGGYRVLQIAAAEG